MTTRTPLNPQPTSNGLGDRGIEHLGGLWWRIWSKPLGYSTDVWAPTPLHRLERNADGIYEWVIDL